MQSEHYPPSARLRTLRSRMLKALWVLVPWHVLACAIIMLEVAENTLHFMARNNVPFSWGVLLRDTMLDSPWSSFAFSWLQAFSLSVWCCIALALLPALSWRTKIIGYIPLTVFCLLQLAWMRWGLRDLYSLSVNADYAHQLPAWFRWIIM